MSGIFFDLPSVRFVRRFRFFETMMRTFASSLGRWLNAPACRLRQVYFRHDEAEFLAASQSAGKQVEWSLADSRAANGVLSVFGTLRLSNNWVKLKDYYELLFIWETLAPAARGIATQRWPRTFSGAAAARSQSAEKDILAAGGRIFWKRRGRKENSSHRSKRYKAFPG